MIQFVYRFSTSTCWPVSAPQLCRGTRHTCRNFKVRHYRSRAAPSSFTGPEESRSVVYHAAVPREALRAPTRFRCPRLSSRLPRVLLLVLLLSPLLSSLSLPLVRGHLAAEMCSEEIGFELICHHQRYGMEGPRPGRLSLAAAQPRTTIAWGRVGWWRFSSTGQMPNISSPKPQRSSLPCTRRDAEPCFVL